MKYAPAMKKIAGTVLAPYLFEVAPMEQDMRENSDLVVLMARDIRVACRARAPEYMRSYLYDITIRSGRSNSVATELQKLMAGFGHAFFYGFRAPQATLTFAAWRMLSLNKFRRLFAGFETDGCWTASDFIDFAKVQGIRRCGRTFNHDGLTDFVYFDVRELADIPGMVLASEPAILPASPPLPEWQCPEELRGLPLFERGGPRP